MDEAHLLLLSLRKQLYECSAKLQGLQGVGGSDSQVDEGWIRTKKNLQRVVPTGHMDFADHFSLLSAVQVDDAITAVLPASDVPGSPNYLVLGDSQGKLYFFEPLGALLKEHDTGAASAVTCICSYLQRRNYSTIVTGHQNGQIRYHLVQEHVDRRTRATDILDTSLIYILEPNFNSAGKAQPPAVEGLQTHKVGSKSSAVALDSDGGVRVLRANGTVRLTAQLQPDALATHTGGNMLVAITPAGVQVAVLLPNRAPRDLLCEGLAGAVDVDSGGEVGLPLGAAGSVGPPGEQLVAAAFDVARSFRAYALTQHGDLLTLAVPAERRSLVCKVLHRQALGLRPAPSRGSVSLQALRGYLLLSHSAGLAVFNVTTSMRVGPGLVLAQRWSHVGSALGVLGHDLSATQRPLLASNAESQLVVVALRDDVALIMRSDMPSSHQAARGGASSGADMRWYQPIFAVLMVVVGVWTFMRQSRHGGGPPAPRMFSGGSAGPLGDYQRAMRHLHAQTHRRNRPGVQARQRTIPEEAADHEDMDAADYY